MALMNIIEHYHPAKIIWNIPNNFAGQISNFKLENLFLQIIENFIIIHKLSFFEGNISIMYEKCS